MPKIINKYTVLFDTREQQPWSFEPDEFCAGSRKTTLKTGDYTIEGCEDIFVVEKKASTAEIAGNFINDAFERELERLEEFAHPFLIMEFDMRDVLAFPHGSGIPSRIWPKLKITGNFLLKRIIDFECKYKTKFIFAGESGDLVATAIFKKMMKYAKTST